MRRHYRSSDYISYRSSGTDQTYAFSPLQASALLWVSTDRGTEVADV